MQRTAQEVEYIVYQLNKMARKLDRTPLQNEFEKVVSRHYIEKNFGTYNELLKEVGLEPNKENVGRKKPQSKQGA
jgi:hypothetical protein